LIESYVGSVRWSRNSMVPAYHRTDWRLARTFRVGGKAMEVAYTGRSSEGNHAEYRPSQVVAPRHFVSLRLDF
ncbi:MAG TPA: hypothetical protein VFK74_09825, partial [Azospira sp.]|nr:hypothetical protein [Azospira sp.]